MVNFFLDTQQIDIRHNDIQHNDIKHYDIQYNDTQHNKSCIMLNVAFYLLLCWVSLCGMSLCWVSWCPCSNNNKVAKQEINCIEPSFWVGALCLQTFRMKLKDNFLISLQRKIIHNFSVCFSNCHCLLLRHLYCLIWLCKYVLKWRMIWKPSDSSRRQGASISWLTLPISMTDFSQSLWKWWHVWFQQIENFLLKSGNLKTLKLN